MITALDTEIQWMKNLSGIPIIGGAFDFLLMFVMPAIFSTFIMSIPSDYDPELVFEISMLFFLPTWNFLLWNLKVKIDVYLFFLPSWMLLVIIALVNGGIMIFEFYSI